MCACQEFLLTIEKTIREKYNSLRNSNIEPIYDSVCTSKRWREKSSYHKTTRVITSSQSEELDDCKQPKKAVITTSYFPSVKRLDGNQRLEGAAIRKILVLLLPFNAIKAALLLDVGRDLGKSNSRYCIPSNPQPFSIEILLSSAKLPGYSNSAFPFDISYYFSY